MTEELTPDKVRAARLIAVLADLLQILLMPAFFPGILSPANDLIDVLVAVVLLRLLGWHWAFLPTFVAELMPFGVNLVPTWTAAVFLATRNRAVVAPPPGVVVDAEARRVDAAPALPGRSQAPRGPSGA